MLARSEAESFSATAAAAENFDAREAKKQLVAATPDARERKLFFRDQCAILATLYDSPGMKRIYIRKVFGVSEATIAKMASCLKYDPRPYRIELALEEGAPPAGMSPDALAEAKFRGMLPVKIGENLIPQDFNRNRNPDRIRHYPAVAAEFEKLGPEEFVRRYYTEEVHLRLMAAKREVDEEIARAARGPMIDHRANDYRGVWEFRGLVEPHPILTFAVDWLEGEGWRFGGPHCRIPHPGRYRTSEIAYKKAMEAESLVNSDIVRGPLPIPDDYKFFTPQE